jgi:two-component system sensor kinase FixL
VQGVEIWLLVGICGCLAALAGLFILFRRRLRESSDRVRAQYLDEITALTLRQRQVERSCAALLEGARRAQEQIREVVRDSPFAVAMFDREMRYLECSARWLRLYGGGRESLRGLLHYDLVPDPSRAWRDQQERGMRGEVLGASEEVWVHADGSRSWFDWAIQPWRDAQGEIGGITILIEDLTERKRDRTELLLRQERLEIAMDAARLGRFERNIAEGTLEWDARVREILAVDPEEPASFAAFEACVHPDDQANLHAEISGALDPSGPGRYSVEYRVYGRKDGVLRKVLVHGRVRFERGHPVRLTGMMQDVTDRRALEKEIQAQRSEFESLMRMQVAAQTTTAIAHELNQPLVAISAYCEAAVHMLQEPGTDPAKLRYALTAAVRQTQRAGQTLHYLLDFMRRGDAPLESVDVALVVQDCIEFMEGGNLHGVRIETQAPEGLPPAQSNSLQLKKVLINLLQNAVDAMRANAGAPGVIRISLRPADEAGFGLVTVRDEGPGLDPDGSQRIFEPFYSTKSTGVGLGLAISKAIIESQGGRLWADFVPGPGATFHFTVPLAS